jgi:DNA polymerase IIIc chi subunit
MRGQWKSKGKKNEDGTPMGSFVFQDFKPLDFVPHLIASEEMPPSNPTDFYPTPKHVVKMMIEWAELQAVCDFDDKDKEYAENVFSSWFVPESETLRILEPSAGIGGIADQLRKVCPNYQLDVVEYLPINASILRGKGYEVHEQDFMTWMPPYKYNAILMNPPFAGTTYIDHVMHAWSLLKEPSDNAEAYGVLVAILPTSWMSLESSAKVANFRKFVTEYGLWETLPSKTFKDSGTNVETCIVLLNTDKRHSSSDEHYKWQISVILDNNFTYGLYQDYVKMFDSIDCDSKIKFEKYKKFDDTLWDIAQQIVRYHQGYKTNKNKYGQETSVTNQLGSEGLVQHFRPRSELLHQIIDEWVIDRLDYFRENNDCNVDKFVNGWKMYREHKKIKIALKP